MGMSEWGMSEWGNGEWEWKCTPIIGGLVGALGVSVVLQQYQI